MAANHTPECEARAAATLLARAEWLTMWGGTFCSHCKGYGQFTEYNYPHEPDWTEPCEDCTVQGRCPRCGSIGHDDSEVSCTLCGWTPKDGGLPVEVECICPMEPFDDDFTKHAHTCGICKAVYMWSADDIAWKYEALPFMPCGDMWKFLDKVIE